MIKIEVYRVVPKEYRFDAAGHLFPACDLRFAVQLGLYGDPDEACLAAAGLCRGFGAMYAGDRVKIVVYVNEERAAQYVGIVDRHGGIAEALGRFFDGCRPHAHEWPYCVRYALKAAA